MKKKLLILALLIGSSVAESSALGLLNPYDFMTEPACSMGQSKFQWSIISEFGYKSQGFDVDSNEVNALQIYETQQNLLGLFQGYQASQSQFNNIINQVAGANGVQNSENGLFTPTGNFSASQCALSGIYNFYDSFYFKVFLPIHTVKLSDVSWNYTGNSNYFSGANIQEQLVSSFEADAKKLFGLSVGDWSETGVGDLTCLIDYKKNFPQGRNVLRNVCANLGWGLSFPTGKKSNPDVIMSIPFGNDGSVSMPFGGGLDLNIARYLQCGFRGQFFYFWGNEKERRVKTFARQTTLLLPEKINTYKDYGFVQNFGLYAQMYNLAGGLSCKFAYEYLRKSEDTIAVDSTGFSYELINTDLSLEETTQHQVIVALAFDSGFTKKIKKMHPQVTTFVKIPFNGSYSNLVSSVGVQLSLDW